MARSRKRIGALSATLTVQHAAFLRDMQRASGAVRSFATSAIGLASRALVKFGAIGTAVAGGGLTFLIKKSFESVDALAKTADRIGVTTEALKVMQVAGNLAGVDLETMNKSIEIMLKNLGDATFGRGVAVHFLKTMGLEASKLVKLPLEEQFRTILSGVRRINTAAGRMAAVRGIFGRGGAGLLNLDPAEIDDVLKALGKAGALISRFDAGKIEAVNDAITLMRASLEGVINILSVEIAPFIWAFVKEVSNVIPELAKGANEAIDAVISRVERIGVAWDNITGAVGDFLFRLKSVVLAMDKLLSDIGIPRGSILPKSRIKSIGEASAKFQTGGPPIMTPWQKFRERMTNIEQISNESFKAAEQGLSPVSEASAAIVKMRRNFEAKVAKIRFKAEIAKLGDKLLKFGQDVLNFVTGKTLPSMKLGKGKGRHKLPVLETIDATFQARSFEKLGVGGFNRVPFSPQRVIENTIAIAQQQLAVLKTIAHNTADNGDTIAD